MTSGQSPANQPPKSAGKGGQKPCNKCGKPFAPDEHAGTLAAHLFQDNYCRCGDRGAAQSPKPGGFLAKLSGLKTTLNLAAGGQKKAKKDEEEFCPKCGLKIAGASLPGSLTGYLFQDVRCNCPKEADFTQGAMAAKLWKLKQTNPGSTFRTLSEREKQTAPSAIALASGATIGGAYRIIEQIGAGGMGEIYLAEHTGLNMQCALKLIPPEQVTELGWRRFQQEARSISKLQHINLVKVTDLGIHEGCLPFYAMEYIEGKTLSDLLVQSGVMTLDTAIEIFSQVCDGVDHAHRAGIVHRDIKPANIMVTENNKRKQVKILDFGLAKLTQKDREQQSLTAVGDVFGSPFYMSPEQCAGQKVDNRSDIYSVGCTMFECLTGRPPFTGHLAAAILMCHAEVDPPTLASTVGPKVFPQSMEVVMAKLLRKNPVERYQTLTELKADLEKVGRGQEVLPFYVSRSTQGANERKKAKSKDGTGPSSGAEEMDRGRSPGKKVAMLLSFLALSGIVVFLIVYMTPVLLKRNTKTPQPVAVAALEDNGPSSALELPIDAPRSLDDLSYLQISSRKPKVAPKSASDKSFFSETMHGRFRNFRVFRFPTDTEIGLISTPQHPIRELAKGVQRFPETEAISFCPGPIVTQFPSYYKRFRPAEISCLEFDPRQGSNDQIHSWKAFSGLKQLKQISLISCTKLDLKSMEILGSCNNLETFACSSAAIDDYSLSRFGFLPHLKSLYLRDYSSTDYLLDEISDSTSITNLTLGHCSIRKTGFAFIAGMPALEFLTIPNSIQTNDELAILSKAPHLKELFLDDSIALNDKSILILQSIKTLERLHVGSIKYGPDQNLVNKLKRFLPTVQLTQTEARSNSTLEGK